MPSLFNTAIGNDRRSSLRVAPGTRVLLYSDVDYRGACQVFTGDVWNLSLTRIGNDSVSSLRFRLTDSCPNSAEQASRV